MSSDGPVVYDLIADALADLPETEADVLRLYHADGLSFQEIGDRLGLSRKSIRNLRARRFESVEQIMDGPRK